MKTEYKINSLKETADLAEIIANQLSIGDVILLKGVLGAGKTYFSSCLINYLLKKQNLPRVEVLSPTFNIVKEYKTNEYSIYHFDLYRIKSKKELYELDIENSFENGISIIEWPEIAEELIYNIKMIIEIEIISKNKRIFTINYEKSI